MEVYTSQLPAKAYCAILRQKLDSPFYVFDERINGIVIGHCFSIAHHAQWEWNRKITCETNRAWGYVRERDGKTEVRFIRGRGLLAPSWILFYTLVCVLTIFFGVGAVPGEAWLASFGIAVFIGLVTAFQDSLTENGIAGAGEISRILRNPKEYYC